VKDEEVNGQEKKGRKGGTQPHAGYKGEERDMEPFMWAYEHSMKMQLSK